MTLRLAPALAACLWISACASFAPQPRTPAARAEPFDLLGRVLVRYDGRAFSSNLRWQHAARDDEIWLMTPALQTLAHIVDAPGGATLTAADQTQYHAASVEALTRRALAWELPLGRLQFWVRGRPAPGSDPTGAERDADNRYARFSQDGWRVTLEYFARDEHRGLPRRLELAGAGQEIRLVIDSWRAAPGEP